MWTKNQNMDLYKIAPVVGNGGLILYHTIEFGEYPKTYVGDKLNKKLEREMLRGALKATGKEYIANYDDGNFFYNSEYEYLGEKYVRTINKYYNDNSIFLDGSKPPKYGTLLWVKVEPITWIIKNWEDMPKEINPAYTSHFDGIFIADDFGV